MIVQCQKCGKDYEPKRRGGKFCSTSCRVVQHQLVKKKYACPNPPTANEVYLAAKLAAVGQSCSKTLAQVKSLPPEQALAELTRLVQGWSALDNNSIIESIQRRDKQDRQARDFHFRAVRQSRAAISVSNKRKSDPLA